MDECDEPLIAWDLPAFPGYLDVKRALFTTLEPRWEPFFDEAADVDWRHVGWGGVLIDDRVLADGEGCERGCIPALDDPTTTGAAGGDWYPDDELVFGIEIDGEARAYPKNMMEVHEMVNDTLGGRRIAVPYCTLCGSAQAFLTDDSLSMRTSGLLIRSNKMMFELGTMSLVDTFLGVGTSGPLQGRQFEQVSVATSTWGAWKAAHPDTTILAEDGGIGRSYAADPLRGRDDNGPIFPVGADRRSAPRPAAGAGCRDRRRPGRRHSRRHRQSHPAVRNAGLGRRPHDRIGRRRHHGSSSRRNRRRWARGLLVRLEPVPTDNPRVADRLRVRQEIDSSTSPASGS